MNRRYFLLGAAIALVAAERLLRDRYDNVVDVHIDVLAAMADKASAFALIDRRPSPNDMTELMYPLGRARQFLDRYQGESDRPSYAAFADLVDAYAKLVAEIDAERGSDAAWRRFRPTLDARIAPVREAVARVRALRNA